MSYPDRAAFFCSSTFILSMSETLALMDLYGGGLIDGLDMESDGHFRIHFQKLRQQLVRELRGQNLQVGGGTPSRPHPNRRLKRKSKLSGAIKSLVESPVFGDHIP